MDEDIKVIDDLFEICYSEEETPFFSIEDLQTAVDIANKYIGKVRVIQEYIKEVGE